MNTTATNVHCDSSKGGEPARRAAWIVAVLGVLVGIAGWATGLLHRRRQRTASASPDMQSRTRDSTPDSEAFHCVPQGITPTSDATSGRRAAANQVDIKAAITRHPGLTLAVAVYVVATLTAPVVILDTLADRPSHAAPQPSRTSPRGAGEFQAQEFGSPAQLIPAAVDSGAACGQDCGGQRFTMVFGEPWQVTGLGFRPLQLISGRRVTKVRWELNDPGRNILPQSTDDGQGDVLSLVSLGRDAFGRYGYRTLSVTAVVLDSVPAPEARLAEFPSERPPLVAYGNRAEDAAAASNDVTVHRVFGQDSTRLTFRFRQPIVVTSIVFAPGERQLGEGRPK